MRCMMFFCLKGLIIVHIRQLIRLGNRKACAEYFILFLSVSVSTLRRCLPSLKMCCSALCDVCREGKGRQEQTFGFVAHFGPGLYATVVNRGFPLLRQLRFSPVMCSRSLHKTSSNLQRRRNKKLE